MDPTCRVADILRSMIRAGMEAALDVRSYGMSFIGLLLRIRNEQCGIDGAFYSWDLLRSN